MLTRIGINAGGQGRLGIGKEHEYQPQPGQIGHGRKRSGKAAKTPVTSTPPPVQAAQPPSVKNHEVEKIAVIIMEVVAAGLFVIWLQTR